jgi:hypothetical protein
MQEAVEVLIDAEFAHVNKENDLFEGVLGRVPKLGTVTEVELKKAVDDAYDAFRDLFEVRDTFVQAYKERRLALCEEAARAFFESNPEDLEGRVLPEKYHRMLDTRGGICISFAKYLSLCEGFKHENSRLDCKLYDRWRRSVMRAGARAGKKLVRPFAGFVEERYGFPPTAVQQERAARAAVKAADGEEGEVNVEAAEKARDIESDDSEMERVATDNPVLVAFQATRAPVKRSIDIVERDHPDFYRYMLGLGTLATEIHQANRGCLLSG